MGLLGTGMPAGAVRRSVPDSERVPSASQRDALTALAGFLDAHAAEIAVEWMDQVRANPSLEAADPLARPQLEDHIPTLIAELVERMRGTPAPHAREEEAAEAHGAVRWRQGYRLDEVLLELGLIRDVLLAFTQRFVGECPGFGEAARMEAVRLICRWSDRIGATSAQQFVQEQAAQLMESARQIEQASHDLQHANDELRALGESRLRLLRTVSHELRNALNSVDLAAQSLVQDEPASDHGAIVAVLFRSVRELHELLDRLLEFSSILSGADKLSVRTVDLRELAGDFLQIYRPHAELRGIQLEVRAETAPESVVSDPLRLKQIVNNLMSNAFKYTTRGRVTLRFAASEPGRWSIVVEDTGMGIAEEDLEQVFREFHRSRRTAAIRGTGLGLPITRHLTTLLGGSIKVSSELDKGSRFEVTLPLSLAATAAPPAIAPPGSNDQ
jgi:signal transduction histidine kinase